MKWKAWDYGAKKPLFSGKQVLWHLLLGQLWPNRRKTMVNSALTWTTAVITKSVFSLDVPCLFRGWLLHCSIKSVSFDIIPAALLLICPNMPADERSHFTQQSVWSDGSIMCQNTLPSYPSIPFLLVTHSLRLWGLILLRCGVGVIFDEKLVLLQENWQHELNRWEMNRLWGVTCFSHLFSKLGYKKHLI